MNGNKEAVGIAGAASLVLTTGVALVAVFVPDLTQVMQVAILAFGNALILLGSVVWARSRVYSKETVARITGTTPDTIPVSPP